MANTIKNLLRSVLKNENNWKTSLLKTWPDVIGSLHTKVKLEKIQDTTLVLSVVDACWLQELYLLSPILLRTINQKLDRPRIKRLRFKQAGIKKEAKQQEKPRQNKVHKVVNLTSKERAALKNVDDAQLASVLERFLIRCYQEKE